MNENYWNKIDPEYDEKTVKDIFEKAEDFLDKTHKFLKSQLTTSKERRIQRRLKKIFISSIILIGSFIVIFILVKLGISIFGPKHGLLAQYYNNINLKETAAVEKIDKKIDFTWGNSSPHSRIIGQFSAKWEGKIKINKNDNYTFYVQSDEGVRLYLEDKVVIDTWLNKKRPIENSGKLYLQKGFHNIKLEYYFNQQHATLKLLWSSNSFKKRTVGNKFLFPPPEKNVAQ